MRALLWLREKLGLLTPAEAVYRSLGLELPRKRFSEPENPYSIIKHWFGKEKFEARYDGTHVYASARGRTPRAAMHKLQIRMHEINQHVQVKGPDDARG